jgi:hypothetical protein
MKKILSLSFSLLLFTSIQAKEITPKLNNTNNHENTERAGDCNPAFSEFDLAINNVRAKILNGGDMWWDLVGAAKYEIPIG